MGDAGAARAWLQALACRMSDQLHLLHWQDAEQHRPPQNQGDQKPRPAFIVTRTGPTSGSRITLPSATVTSRGWKVGQAGGGLLMATVGHRGFDLAHRMGQTAWMKQDRSTLGDRNAFALRLTNLSGSSMARAGGAAGAGATGDIGGEKPRREPMGHTTEIHGLRVHPG